MTDETRVVYPVFGEEFPGYDSSTFCGLFSNRPAAEEFASLLKDNNPDWMRFFVGNPMTVYSTASEVTGDK